jgi:hypothetical protein
MTDRFASTLVIAASIIAAVRLVRDDISRPSPRLTSVVTDSIGLARTILESVVRYLRWIGRDREAGVRRHELHNIGFD